MKLPRTIRPAPILAAVLSLCLAGYLAVWPALGYTADRPLPIYCVDRPEKVCAISFDAAWGADNTQGILDVLAKYNVKATFFVVGCQAEKDPDIVRRIADEGHQVGNHSYDHADLHTLTAAQAAEDLRRNDDLLRQLLGDGDYWVRPPYGLLAERDAAALPVPLVNWSVDTEDWRTKDCGKILDVIYRCTGDGDIVLLHDRYQSSVDAALTAIAHLQEQGYVFVTVAELLALRGVTPEPGVTYRRAPPQEAEGG